MVDLFESVADIKIFKSTAEMNHPEAGLVAAVTPKLPDFWPHNADAWLLQVEAQFRISKIVSSQTKFDLTVQKLNEATVCCLLDLLKNPPQDSLKA